MFLTHTFRAFRYRDYFIFWLGLFLGHNGSLIQTTAAGWLILQLTDSPFYLGLNGLCLGLPRMIFSPLGGAVVDRMDRRSLFIVTQSVFLLMAVFLGVMNYTGLIQVWHCKRRWISVPWRDRSPLGKRDLTFGETYEMNGILCRHSNLECTGIRIANIL